MSDTGRIDNVGFVVTIERALGGWIVNPIWLGNSKSIFVELDGAMEYMRNILITNMSKEVSDV